MEISKRAKLITKEVGLKRRSQVEFGWPAILLCVASVFKLKYSYIEHLVRA